MREQVAPLLQTDTPGELEALVRRLGTASGTRVTVIAGEGLPGKPLGLVLAESTMSPAEMENHRDRPEFEARHARRLGTAVRFSHTLDENMMYVAVPVTAARGEQRGTVAVVRAAVPLTAVDQALSLAVLAHRPHGCRRGARRSAHRPVRHRPHQPADA